MLPLQIHFIRSSIVQKLINSESFKYEHGRYWYKSESDWLQVKASDEIVFIQKICLKTGAGRIRSYTHEFIGKL